MRRAVVAMAALAALGAPAGASEADGLSVEALMGRWCSDAGAYVFTPTELTVIHVDGGKTVQPIDAIDVEGADIVVRWQPNRGKGGTTTFSNFVDKRMDQLFAKGGSKSPGRAFHRC